MAANFAVTTSFRALDRISGAFDRMSKHGKKFGNDAQDAFRKASRSGSRFGDIVKGILVTDLLKSGTRAIWNMAKASIGLASDLTEVQNVVDTTFGPSSAEQINKWSKTAIQNFGISELQAKKFTGTLGALMKSSGVLPGNLVKMSTELSGLAGDFASFYNLNIEDAFEKIKSGISGETEPLKALGINMSVANLEAFALTQGINKQWKAMTQAEQVQLRYNYLMEKSADAQGDFFDTLKDSMANQQRVLETKLKQAGATLMKGFVPLLTKGMGVINDALDSVDFDKLSDNLTGAITRIGVILKPLFDIIKPILVKTGQLFVDIGRSVGDMNWSPLITALGIVARAFGLVIDIIKILWKVAKPIINGILFLLEPLISLMDTIMGSVERLFQLVGISEKPNPEETGQTGGQNTQIQAPNQNQAAAQSGSYNGTLTIKDETKRAQLSEKRRGAQPVRTELLGQQ